MLERFEKWLKKWFRWVPVWWGFVKDVTAVLKPCRFSVIMLAVGFVFLVLSAQGQDVLRVMVEGSIGREMLWQWTGFFIAMTLWGVNAWYWARVMLRCRFDEDRRFLHTDEQRAGRIAWLSRHLPRILGTLGFVSLALAFLRAGIASDYAAIAGVEAKLYIFAGLSLILGAAFLIFVIYRGPLILAAARTLQQGRFHNSAGKVYQGAKETFRLQPQRCIESLSDFPTGTRWALLISLTIGTLLLLLFTVNAQLAGNFGSASIVLLAAGYWIPLGSVLVYVGSRYKVPALGVMLGLAVLFSFVNDNHKLRTVASPLPAPNTLETHFANWLEPKLQQADDGRPRPIFLVAAEGGGIRAAYWAGIVLAALHDIDSDFGKDLYAISAVSGGSLGAAVFVGLLKEQQQQQRNAQLSCRPDEEGEPATVSVQACAEAVLGHDFLAPAVAGMLYPDLTQRFLPFPVDRLDRARALEMAWERGWRDTFDNEALAGSFHQLWTGASPQLPSLFLNGTWVKTGKRIITSNIAIDAAFPDAVDFFTVHPQAIPLSTAAHNSARFTYVSPAGLISNDKDGLWGRIVDGGYFENSGATTAAEIFRVLSAAPPDRFVPVFIMITNNPDACSQAERAANKCPSPKPAASLSEALSPLTSILETRNARGSQSRAAMEKLVQSKCGLFIELGLEGQKGPLPLGWTMSRTAHTILQQALEEKLLPLNDDLSLGNLKKIASSGGPC